MIRNICYTLRGMFYENGYFECKWPKTNQFSFGFIFANIKGALSGLRQV